MVENIQDMGRVRQGSETLGGGERVRLLTGEARRRPPAGESSRLRPRGGLGERLLRRGGESLRDSLRRGGDAGLHSDIATIRLHQESTVKMTLHSRILSHLDASLMRCSQCAY